MNKHTPGPWIFGKNGASTEETACIEISAKTCNYYRQVAYIQSSAHVESGISVDRAVANSRLIASAPELLAELEMLSNIVEGCGLATIPEVECRIAFARAVIAKATGESA